MMFNRILRADARCRRRMLLLLVFVVVYFCILFCWEKETTTHKTVRKEPFQEYWESWLLDDLKIPTAVTSDVMNNKSTPTLWGSSLTRKFSLDPPLIIFIHSADLTTQRLQDVVSEMMNSESYSSTTYTQRKERICGAKWQEDYKKLHRDILESRRPRQFIVFTCEEDDYSCAGYGNRLGAISSLLFLSILTQRAFLIQWNVDVYVPLEFYLNPKEIAWNYSMKNLKKLATRTHFWAKGKLSRLDRTDVLRPAYTFQNFSIWLQETDFQTYFDHPVEKVVGSWNFADNLWENKFLKKYALELGINSERANHSLVGCAFDFLFQKLQELEARLDAARISFGLRSQAPKLGLHVRMGDIYLGKITNKEHHTDYKEFFNCAQALSEALARQNPRVFQKEDIKWFLATDDTEVKEYALVNYPKNAVTQTINPQHIKLLKKLTHSASVESMYGIMVDHFLLSECDFLILTGGSTFGRTAAGLTFHTGGVELTSDVRRWEKL